MVRVIVRMFRELILTIIAMCVLVRTFIVRWFLPLHGEEDPEPRDAWGWDDEKKPAALPAPVAKLSAPVEPVLAESLTDDLEMEPAKTTEPEPSGEVFILPPEGNAERVSRTPSGGYSTALDSAPEAIPPPTDNTENGADSPGETAAADPLIPVNPFTRDGREDPA